MEQKLYEGSFVKKNSEVRKMTFVKLEDVPADFLSTKIKNPGQSKEMPLGMELVWDVDASDFRVFNYKSQVGDLVAKKLTEEKKKEIFATKGLDK